MQLSSYHFIYAFPFTNLEITTNSSQITIDQTTKLTFILIGSQFGLVVVLPFTISGTSIESVYHKKT